LNTSEQEAAQQLGKFQTNLSQCKPAQVTVAITARVFRSISHLHNPDKVLTAKAMADAAGVTPKTGTMYIRGEQTPPFSRFVKMMDKLGYDVFLVKRNGL